MTLNPYIYGSDNPVNNVDPGGNYRVHFSIWHTEHDVNIDPIYGRYWWYDRHFTKKRWRAYAHTKQKGLLGMAMRSTGRFVSYFPRSARRRRMWHRHFDTTTMPLRWMPVDPITRYNANVIWGLKGWLFERGSRRLPSHVRHARHGRF